MNDDQRMTEAERIMVAAYTEAGYSVRSSGGLIQVVGAPPCEVNYRAAWLARSGIGEDTLGFDEWHERNEQAAREDGRVFRCTCAR